MKSILQQFFRLLLIQIQQFVALTLAFEHKIRFPSTSLSQELPNQPFQEMPPSSVFRPSFINHHGYNSTFGTGRVTPINNSFLGQQMINSHLINNVISSLSSAGGKIAVQREIYNLLHGSQVGTCSRKLSNADHFFERSLSNEPLEEHSLNNFVSNIMQNNEQSQKKREVKAGDKHEGSAGIFNFGGSFKPKDATEGTLQSIKRLRKQSLDLPPSQNTLERELNNPPPLQPISASKLDLFTSHIQQQQQQLPPNLQLIADQQHRESVLSDDRNSYGLQHLINVALANNSINNGVGGNLSNQGFTPIRPILNFMKANTSPNKLNTLKNRKFDKQKTFKLSVNGGSPKRNRSLSLDHPKSDTKLPFEK